MALKKIPASIRAKVIRVKPPSVFDSARDPLRNLFEAEGFNK